MWEEYIYFHGDVSKYNIKLKKYYAENFSKTSGIEIQSEHRGVKRKQSM